MCPFFDVDFPHPRGSIFLPFFKGIIGLFLKEYNQLLSWSMGENQSVIIIIY